MGDRTLDKYKSRVVIKGFQQTIDIDHIEAFRHNSETNHHTYCLTIGTV